MGWIGWIGEAARRRTRELAREADALIGRATFQGWVVGETYQTVLFEAVKAEWQPEADVILVAIGRMRKPSGSLAYKWSWGSRRGSRAGFG